MVGMTDYLASEGMKAEGRALTAMGTATYLVSDTRVQ